MPFFTYKCSDCNCKFDYLHFYKWAEKDLLKDKPPAIIDCDCDNCQTCTGKAKQQISLFARTPSQWGNDTAYFDRGLGLTIENEPHRQRIMKERGLRNVDKTEVEESIHAGYAEKMEQEKNGGYEIPQEIIDEATELGNDENLERQGVVDENTPEGMFSEGAMNSLIEKVNEVMGLFNEEGCPTVEGDQEKFSSELVAKLMMISESANDALVDFDINLQEIKDDRDVEMLTGEVALIAQDKDYQRHLLGDSKTPQVDEEDEDEATEDLMAEEQMETNEPSDEEIKKLFMNRA